MHVMEEEEGKNLYIQNVLFQEKTALMMVHIHCFFFGF